MDDSAKSKLNLRFCSEAISTFCRRSSIVFLEVTSSWVYSSFAYLTSAIMPKEDRSDWVAVAPQFASKSASAMTDSKIKPAVSAFQFFQRDVTEEVKAEMTARGGTFEVGLFSRAVRDRWNSLDPDRKSYYEGLAREDQMRFGRESHAADIAAIERRERLQRERDQLLLDDEGGTRRTTRGRMRKKEQKRERKEKRTMQRKKSKSNSAEDDEDDFDEEEEESSDSFEADDDSEESDVDSDDSSRPKKAKKKKAPPRQPTQKQLEYRKKIQLEKKEKENLIAERQEDLRKEKASQAKRRLEFLLKQSSIFSHFGQVKQDQAKYGIKTSVSRASRRDSVEDNDQNEEELDEADEHQATFLTSQPTTIGFGKMRDYQLEGLNWMIRLQENGVNGILADEVSQNCCSFH